MELRVATAKSRNKCKYTGFNDASCGDDSNRSIDLMRVLVVFSTVHAKSSRPTYICGVFLSADRVSDAATDAASF